MRTGLAKAAALGVIAAGLAGAWWLHRGSGIEWTPAALREQIAALGALGPVLLIAVMAMRPFLGLNSAPVLFAAGFLFGPVAGTFYGAAGGALGGTIVFSLGRVLGRSAVQARVGDSLGRFDAHLARHGAPWLGAYTAVPVSILSPVFFTAGVTSMRLLPFTTAVGLGFIPRAGLYTFLGETAGQPSAINLIAAMGAVGLAATAVWLARRHLLPPPPQSSGGR